MYGDAEVTVSEFKESVAPTGEGSADIGAF
jgi:hypothetical protein